MKCSKCGTVHGDGLNFCTNCGEKLSKEKSGKGIKICLVILIIAVLAGVGSVAGYLYLNNNKPTTLPMINTTTTSSLSDKLMTAEECDILIPSVSLLMDEPIIDVYTKDMSINNISDDLVIYRSLTNLANVLSYDELENPDFEDDYDEYYSTSEFMEMNALYGKKNLEFDVLSIAGRTYTMLGDYIGLVLGGEDAIINKVSKLVSLEKSGDDVVYREYALFVSTDENNELFYVYKDSSLTEKANDKAYKLIGEAEELAMSIIEEANIYEHTFKNVGDSYTWYSTNKVAKDAN